MVDVVTANLAKETAKVKDAMGAALETITTTAALNAVGNDINTKGKYQGKRVWNSTTFMYAVAVGPLAADAWRNPGTGSVTHAPV